MALKSLPLFVLPAAQGLEPFWGCGLLGKDIDPTQATWQNLITDLKKTNHFNQVGTWNWDIKPQSDEHLSSDFFFFPNVQCAGTSAGAYTSYMDQNSALPDGAHMGTLALGGNEPDQVGFCQNYTTPLPSSSLPCDGFKMRDNQCTGADECYCKYDAAAGLCRYDVTGCGMWPIGSSNAECKGSPFPFWCFGKEKKECAAGQDPSECCSAPCHAGMLSAFSQFYVEMAYKGYTYATTPIVATDLTFTEQMLEEAGCGAAEVKALSGKERLQRGCPTHSAFHFYSTGCPMDPEAAVQGFVDRVATAKQINEKYGLAGTIVNELGSLKGTDTTCTDDQIAAMMGRMFEHLETDAGKGVVSQMVWFNEQEIGGTFDLRLIKNGALSTLGQTYNTACNKWAQANGVEMEKVVV